MASVAIAVIARNEGERLQRCLDAVQGADTPKVYVDSGSTDGSVDVARATGWGVMELDPSTPFSAARARNEGFAHLVQTHPSVEFVQFLDGDCELCEGWLEHAVSVLRARPEVAIVAGRLRERHPDASVYNRLCDLEWRKPDGEVASCGGIFMARAEAFREVGGFDPSLIAGEEQELCLRLLRHGWKVLRVAESMARHDADMHHFGQWWRRTVRCGQGYSMGAALHGAGPERHYVRGVVSAVLWGAVAPLSMLVGAIAAAWAPWALVAVVGVVLAYGVLAARVLRYRLTLGDGVSDATLYAAFCILAKVPLCLGVALDCAGRRRGQFRTPGRRGSWPGSSVTTERGAP